MEYDFKQCEVSLVDTALIQDFGAIISYSKSNDKIIFSSTNFEEITGIPNPLGKTLKEIFNEKIINFLINENPINEPYFALGDLLFTKNIFEDLITVEIEPNFKDKLYNNYSANKNHSKQELIDDLIKYISDLSEFERVMYYKFLPDGSGEVISEVYKGDIDSYFGLRFPATDIPKVARELYVKNPYRYINDVFSSSVSIKGLENSNPKDLNLSNSILRDVSPFHINYLKNMKVRTAISFPIIKNDGLVGLISLHNKNQKFMTLQKRTAISNNVRRFQIYLAHLENSEFLKYMDQYRNLISAFYQSFTSDSTYMEAVHMVIKNLNANAMISNYKGKLVKVGNIDFSEKLKELIISIINKEESGSFYTDCINSSGNKFNDFAGINLIWFSTKNLRYKNYFAFFKPEITREVVWGSKLEYTGDIHPKNSFGQWKEKMDNHSDPWNEKELRLTKSIQTKGMLSYVDE